MSNLENANFPRPVSPQSPWTWGFMDTALISLIAYGVYALVSGLTLTMLAVPDGAKTLSPAQFQGHGVAYIVACPLTIVVLWIAIRNARRDFAEYLALNWPSSGALRRALAIMAIVMLAESLATYVVGAEEISPDPYISATQPGRFLIFLIGGCIAAPIMEEFVLRGFMFRGWSQSFLGPVGSIVLTSVLWGMIHTQYDWFGCFCIFTSGLALGYFRWRSNSTWLTVMVHSAVNTFIFFTMGLN
jgi:uncharacterized protein